MLSIEELDRYFGDDHFAVGLGISIDSVSETGAVCSMALQQRHLNSQGTAQGGVLFTLADFAFAVAANARQKGTITLDANIRYIRPGKGQRLVATAKQLHAGRQTSVYEVAVTGQNGELAALLTATGFVKQHYIDKSQPPAQPGQPEK